MNAKNGMTPADATLRLARYFGTTPQLWLNLQKTWSFAKRRFTRAVKSQNVSRPDSLRRRGVLTDAHR